MVAILNMFQALYNHSFCEMQTMMMMHNTHTSWGGKPMATTGVKVTMAIGGRRPQNHKMQMQAKRIACRVGG
jgi:hypothetical protein